MIREDLEEAGCGEMRPDARRRGRELRHFSPRPQSRGVFQHVIDYLASNQQRNMR
jgi:hypothetical protein